ncbi:hypothetical protein ACH4E7_44280 [Kitasatospora sp. NPDC018058]|uniref:hypothetical protein n=1 Tax=Kitasatospora sp. NPDC018058 TaxID=3364025 RepID=UPI0037C01A17
MLTAVRVANALLDGPIRLQMAFALGPVALTPAVFDNDAVWRAVRLSEHSGGRRRFEEAGADLGLVLEGGPYCTLTGCDSDELIVGRYTSLGSTTAMRTAPPSCWYADLGGPGS